MARRYAMPQYGNMKLENTQELMRRKLESEFFDAYAVLVGRGGEEAFISSPKVDRDTLFDIASMGKVLVTSTLLLQSVGEGRVTLDDTLDMYFDAVPEEKRGITVTQLLTHTSGIVRVEIPREVTSRGREAIADYILAVPLAFAPGGCYRYSCTGYILLGFIVEKALGGPLDELFYSRESPRLGLTRSRFNIPENEPNAAICHYRAEAGDCMCADSIVYNMNGVAGNGASFWTAADLQRYVLAVLARSEKLYPERFFAMAETNLTPLLEEGRGLGYLVVNDSYRQTGKLFPVGSFGHCGNTGTSFFISRESGLYAVVLTNATRFSYMRRGFKFCKYGETMAMREEVHNAILSDLTV